MNSSADPRVVHTHALVGEAVRALLVEEGWDAITHQRVAARSGLGRNTVYRHFPDRLALLAHGGNFVGGGHHAPITGDVRVDLAAELRCFRQELFDGIVGTIIGAIVERADRDPEVTPLRDHLVELGARQTAELVQSGMDQGLIDDDRRVDDVVSALCGPLLYARLCQARAPSDEAIDAVVDAQLRPPPR
ncbi:MAG: TetR/AcrR family transcriptional regulator [Actinomycetota bacterium]